MVYVDLILDNNELIRIECPNKFEDELHETLEYTMKSKDWWSPAQFDGCAAKYLGSFLSHVNMSRVIGML